MEKIKKILAGTAESEKGQSIVIIAGAMLVLLGMIGLVIDLGVVYVRDAQLRAAVDAAALAAVTELSLGDIDDANQKAVQFMFVNGLPTDSVLNIDSQVGSTELGAVQYTVTATWTVDLYFMTLFAFETVDLEKTATAAYFPLTDIYASTRVSDGALSMTTQAIFGPEICTRYGDPYSPLNSTEAPGIYTYRYRIYIPPDYEDTFEPDESPIVRVELFDPDSINNPRNTHIMNYSEFWRAVTGSSETSRSIECGPTSTGADGGNATDRDTCIIPTCEWDGATSTIYSNACTGIPNDSDLNSVNPFWYIRVDENRGSGTSGVCGFPNNYTPAFNTATIYTLYYFRELPDGSLIRTELASYTGQTDVTGVDFDSFSHNTDIQWVSPGALNNTVTADSSAPGSGIFINDAGLQVGFVPADCNSPNGGTNSSDDTRCPGESVPGEGNGFEVNIATDAPGIAQDDLSIGGARYLYLDVQAVAGASENGFEIYAGPPDDLLPNGDELYPDANRRNVAIADGRVNGDYIRSSEGVTVFAMGVLPNNSVTTFQTDLPLIYVPPTYAGRQINVAIFDLDQNSSTPITFYFDTISRQDWEFNPNTPSQSNDSWLTQFGETRGITFNVPQYDPELCTDPTDTSLVDVCTPFYGGILTANYTAGSEDTSVWEVSLPSLPFLTR